MADVPLSEVAGGLNAFGIVDQVTGNISIGVSGDILTITAPDPLKQYVNLYLLICAGTSSQAGISLIRDGITIKSEAELDDNGAAAPANFRVDRSYASSTDATNRRAILREVKGRSITINKNAGNTLQTITYAYEILEPIE
jgi:hypothetical protein